MTEKQYVEPSHAGHLVLPVLTWLNGQPWDQLAQNFIVSLDPNGVQVIGPDRETKTNWMTNQVTVYLDERGTIQEITQQCRVGLGGNFENGHELWLEAKRRGLLK